MDVTSEGEEETARQVEGAEGLMAVTQMGRGKVGA